MVSRRIDFKEDARFRVIQIINQKSEITTREIAEKVGISNGSAYYLLTALIANGFVKLINCKENPKNIKYSYLLTSKGIRENSLLTGKFLKRKKQDFEALKAEIDDLESSIASISSHD